MFQWRTQQSTYVRAYLYPVERHGAGNGPQVVHKVLCAAFILVREEDEGCHDAHDDEQGDGQHERPQIEDDGTDTGNENADRCE